MNNIFKNQLITLLTLMKSKAEGKGLEPSMRTSTLINMLKTTGTAVGYSQLQQMLQDPAVSSLIKSVDKDRVTLNSDMDDNSSDELDDLDLDMPIEDGMGDQPGMDLDLGDQPGAAPAVTDTTSQPDPNAAPQQSLIPAGPSKSQQIATMATRALKRNK